jgi:hypothetical protein
LGGDGVWVYSGRAVFLEHYNQARPHRGISLDAPIPPQACPDTSAPVGRVDRFRGVIP